MAIAKLQFDLPLQSYNLTLQSWWKTAKYKFQAKICNSWYLHGNFSLSIARVQPAPYPVFSFRARAVKGWLFSCILCCDKQCMQLYQQTLYVPERHDAKHVDDFICCSGFTEFHKTRLSHNFMNSCHLCVTRSHTEARKMSPMEQPPSSP
jgi:hypothetical protein